MALGFSRTSTMITYPRCQLRWCKDKALLVFPRSLTTRGALLRWRMGRVALHRAVRPRCGAIPTCRGPVAGEYIGGLLLVRRRRTSLLQYCSPQCSDRGCGLSCVQSQL